MSQNRYSQNNSPYQNEIQSPSRYLDEKLKNQGENKIQATEFKSNGAQQYHRYHGNPGKQYKMDLEAVQEKSIETDNTFYNSNDKFQTQIQTQNQKQNQKQNQQQSLFLDGELKIKKNGEEESGKKMSLDISKSQSYLPKKNQAVKNFQSPQNFDNKYQQYNVYRSKSPVNNRSFQERDFKGNENFGRENFSRISHNDISTIPSQGLGASNVSYLVSPDRIQGQNFMRDNRIAGSRENRQDYYTQSSLGNQRSQQIKSQTLKQNINIENKQLAILEEKLEQKEKLIRQMKQFHTEVCTAYEEAQEELIKLKKEKKLLNQSNDQEYDNLRIKLKNQQQYVQDLEIENEQLIKQIKEKQLTIKKMEEVNFDCDIKKNQIQSTQLLRMEKRLLELEQENSELRQLEKEESQIVLDYKFKVDQLEEDNARMSLKLDNFDNDTRILLREREELIQKLAKTELNLNESQKYQNMKIHEAILENNKKNEEKLNRALVDYQHKYHQREKKLKEQVLNLREQLNKEQNQDHYNNQNQNKGNQSMIIMGNNRQNSGSFSAGFGNQKNSAVYENQQELTNQLKQSQARIQNLENALQQVQNNYSQLNQISMLGGKQGQEAFDSDNFASTLLQEFNSQDLSDLYQKIKEQKKLAECLQNMVQNCHPKSQFNVLPSLKTSWKWLKKMLEDYMILKKNQQTSKFGGNQIQNQNKNQQYLNQRQDRNQTHSNFQGESEEILEKIRDFLKIDNNEEIINRVADILIENEISHRLFGKVKKELGCEWVISQAELDRLLSEKQNSPQQYSQINQNQNDYLDNNNGDDENQDFEENQKNNQKTGQQIFEEQQQQQYFQNNNKNSQQQPYDNVDDDNQQLFQNQQQQNKFQNDQQ